MIKITEYMSKPIISADNKDTIRDAVTKMAKHDIGSIIIVENKKPIGIVTERDILRVVAKKLDLDTPINKIMTKNVATVTESATVIDIASLMKKRVVRRIVVVNKKGEVIGIVTSKDLIDILCT